MVRTRSGTVKVGHNVGSGEDEGIDQWVGRWGEEDRVGSVRVETLCSGNMSFHPHPTRERDPKVLIPPSLWVDQRVREVYWYM